ncbi:MAG: sigma-70 family RNA polymerase sigma factor [Actinomycetota bacterium]
MTSSDRRLVERARYGDTDAVAEIYGRYGDRVFGLCLTLLRDREAAAEATEDTFLAAWERIEGLRDGDLLRPWLFAIARNRVIGRGRSDLDAVPTEEIFGVVGDATDADALHAAALGRLMWDAAEGLEERDRLLLELSVRQGLEGAELAYAMGIPPARASTLTNRVKGRIERALGALLVARLGREDCDELGAVLAGWDGRFDVSVRRRVVRHVEDCALCSERRATLVAPASLFGALPVVAVPAERRERILTGYSLGTAPAMVELLDDWSEEGWPPVAGSERGAFAAEIAAAPDAVPTEEPDDEWRRRGLVTLGAAAVVALLVGATALLVGRDGDDLPAARIASADAELVEPIAIDDPVPTTTTLLTVTGPTAEVAAREESVPTTASADTDGAAPVAESTVENAVNPPSTTVASPPASSAPGTPPTLQPTPPTISPEPTVTVATTTPTDDSTTTTTTVDGVTPGGSTTTTTTEPQGGQLSAAPGTVTVEPGGTGSFRIANGGPGTVSWSASPSVGLGVSPASGSMVPGGSATVTISVGSRASSGSITVNGGLATISVTVIVVTPTTTTEGPAPTTTTEVDEDRTVIDDDDFEIEIGASEAP